MYLSAKHYFNAYTGVGEQWDSADIYYNHKNITHPSKQYHPYIRNLVEYDAYFDQFANIFNGTVIGDLEETKIMTAIDGYIGKFGNSINFWKNEGIDYSGYSTRYENSYHTSIDGIFSEVIDYDGAFYPPAANLLKSNTKQWVMNNISSRNGELYKRFYKHLSPTDEELREECLRISCFYDAIKKIVEDKTNELDVYDIYKYGMDQYDNCYTLYKKYNKKDKFFDQMTYNDKKNTSGMLWVRRKDTPFSYPVFAKQTLHPNAEIDKQFTILSSTMLSYLNKNSIIDSATGNITDGCIYDFEFTKDKSYIALIVKNNNPDVLKRYDNASIMVSYIQQTKDDSRKKTKIIFADANINTF